MYLTRLSRRCGEGYTLKISSENIDGTKVIINDNLKKPPQNIWLPTIWFGEHENEKLVEMRLRHSKTMKTEASKRWIFFKVYVNLNCCLISFISH